jgi:NMD protein affecting ribosome stability and mRNA decay
MICPQCGKNVWATINEICVECNMANKKDHDQIFNLTQDGHTEYCAERMTWGDGECECNCDRIE